MNARDRLVELEQQYVSSHDGQVPTHLHISRVDEIALSTMTRNEWGGDLAERVQRQGIRAAVHRLLGSTIVWDAEETHFA